MLAFYRIYFNAADGEPLETAWAKGDIRVPTQAEDYTNLPGLAGRSAADTICWEQLTEDAALEALLRSKKPKMDVSQTPPALAWADWPEPEESDTDPVTGEELVKMIEEVV
nr:MAG TPA: hypothetical protein [Caudoviricetes sp.]